MSEYSTATPPDRSDDLTGAVLDGLLRATKRLRRATTHGLAPLGLTPYQERALRTLTRVDTEGIRMGELAERLRVVARSATDVVDDLERDGLVRRAPDPSSRRSVLVSLTEEGRRLQDALRAARRTAGEELLAPLSIEQRRTLADLMARLMVED
jgi:DNA-binding MarR family transcriptional regulator